jgi:MarR family transcriptional regulator for hemolysin
MIKFDYQDSIIFWTITTAHSLERAFNEVLQPLGVTYRQAEVLAWLVVEGQLSQAELAERMRIEAPTLAGIVERMERDGWIQREVSSRDRRKKILQVTERVAPIWEQIRDAGLALRAQASRSIEPALLQNVIRVLEQIQKNVGQHETRPGRAHTVEPSR